MITRRAAIAAFSTALLAQVSDPMIVRDLSGKGKIHAADEDEEEGGHRQRER